MGFKRYSAAPSDRPLGTLIDNRGDHDRDRGSERVRLELRQHLPTVEPRKSNVQHDRGGRDLVDELESLDTVPGPHHPGG